MRWLTIMAAVALASASTAPASDPGSIVLKPAAVFDGVDGRVHPGWQVLVTGDRIVAVGPDLALPPAPG